MAKARIKEFTANNFHKLHDVLSGLRDGWIFRGHASFKWKLVPKAGRHGYGGRDSDYFEAWKRRAAEYVSSRSLTDWDWLAIAQHHGLATRLLDWTFNPLNAAFFAVRERHSGPAIVHAARFEPGYSESVDRLDRSTLPMAFEGVGIFRPREVIPRIIRQGGLFTIHGPAESDLADQPHEIVSLRRIVIEEPYREKLQSELAFYGIHAASLFPDLDGLSAFLNWSAEAGESPF